MKNAGEEVKKKKKDKGKDGDRTGYVMEDDWRWRPDFCCAGDEVRLFTKPTCFDVDAANDFQPMQCLVLERVLLLKC